jgi:hypothetical protein
VGPFLSPGFAVDVLAPGFLPGRGAFAADAPSPARPFRVELERGRSVAGRVVASGVPADRVRLQIVTPTTSPPMLPPGSPSGRFRVESDGRFDTGPLPAGTHTLRATARHGDRYFEGEAVVAAGTRGVDLLLVPSRAPERDATWWTFEVLDPSGRPVPVGHVLFHEEGGVEDGATFYAGRYVHRASAATRAITVLFFDAEDAVGQRLPLAATRVGPLVPGPAPVRVVLAAERSVDVVVLGPGAKPIRGIRVEPLVRGIDEPWAPLRSGVTDDEGRVTVGGFGDDLGVLAIAVPRSMAREEVVRVRPGDAEVKVLLHEAVAARVVVRDPEGAALADATLRIEVAEDDPWTFDDNVLGSVFGGDGSVYERTDASGAASFLRLDPRRAYVLVVVPPEGREDLAYLRLASWRPAKEQTLTLPKGVWIEGQVLDDAGATVAGASVFARTLGGEYEKVARSGPDGRFRIGPLPPAERDLVARRDGAPEPADPSVRAAAGGSAVVLRVR